MKRGQILEGTIERTDFPNKGIMFAEDRKVRVKGGLPGQTVRVAIKKPSRERCEGRLLEVVERSPMESAPDCPHYENCGGCTYRTLSYENQLKLKEEQIKRLLTEACPELPFEGIKASPLVEAYRNKMEFTFGDACKDGDMCLGMHARGSFYDIVTVDQCKIVSADIRKVLTAVLKVASESGIRYFHRRTHEGYFRHLLVRRAERTGEILVDLITSTQIDPATEERIEQQLVEALTAQEYDGKIAGILHTHNDALADAIINEGTKVLYGQDHFYEEILGLRFKITPFSFFQTNSLGAEVLYDTAREYIGETKDKVIFDLYSGTGTIAQMLAPVATHVTGVEIIEEAVEAAKENAALNGLDNCSFIAGDVLKVVDELTEKPDLIVLDPPRDGIHPKAMGKIIGFGVNRIVYISCKPTSLARDLEPLQQAGYRVVRCCAVDMFPGTQHVETVVLLDKG